MARRRIAAIPARPDEIPSLRPAPHPKGSETVEFFDCEQRSDEWHRLHLGVPTASIFGAIKAGGEGRRKLLYQLAGEKLVNEPRETFSNSAMQRGIEMEPEARAHYAFTREVELESIGFARRSFPRGRCVGCSPDSKIVGIHGGIEIKTMAPHLMVELLDGNRTPTEHRAQCQGTLWVTGWDWIDLMIFYRGMPISPSWTFERDEIYIRELAEQVEVFQWEVDKIVERVRNMGARR